MLVLTRKVGDVIAIGDNIKIIVMTIKGKQVRLGIQADKNTIVHREEIYQKIQQETKAAQESMTENITIAKEILKKQQPNISQDASFSKSLKLLTVSKTQKKDSKDPEDEPEE